MFNLNLFQFKTVVLCPVITDLGKNSLSIFPMSLLLYPERQFICCFIYSLASKMKKKIVKT